MCGSVHGRLLPERNDRQLRCLCHGLPHLHRQHHQRLPDLQRHRLLLQVHRRGHVCSDLSQRPVQERHPKCQQMPAVLVSVPILFGCGRQLHSFGRLSDGLLLRAGHEQLQDHLSGREVSRLDFSAMSGLPKWMLTLLRSQQMHQMHEYLNRSHRLLLQRSVH